MARLLTKTPSSSPSAPILVAPPDGAVLYNYPRAVMLRWQPVSNPTGATYRIELQMGYYGNRANSWWPIPQKSIYYGRCAGWVAGTSCRTKIFPGAAARHHESRWWNEERSLALAHVPFHPLRPAQAIEGGDSTLVATTRKEA